MTPDPNVIDLKLAQLDRGLTPFEGAAPSPSGPVAGGGGGPHDPGMDARVTAVEAGLCEIRSVLARLEPVLTRVDERTRKTEADVTKLGTDLTKVTVDLAELKGRVSQLPTTQAIFTYMGSLVALSLAIFGAAYAIVGKANTSTATPVAVQPAPMIAPNVGHQPASDMGAAPMPRVVPDAPESTQPAIAVPEPFRNVLPPRQNNPSGIIYTTPDGQPPTSR